MNEKNNDKKQKLTQEIIDLQLHLTSNTSEIGDWKFIKAQEYEAMKLECPYDMKAYHKAREEVRGQINKLQEELASLDE